MKHLLLPLVLTIICTTGCYNSHKAPSNSVDAPTANITLAEIRALCNKDRIIFSKDMVIQATVISTDEQEYIYRSLFIDDSTAAAELMIGQYSIHYIYPEGVELTLKLKGLAASITDGKLQIGLPAPNHSLYEVDYFESEVIMDKHIIRGNEINTLSPINTTITQLNDLFCGRLVTIANLKYQPETDTNTYNNYYRFTDNSEAAIYLYIREYLDIDEQDIPTSEISLTGIVSHKSQGYIITPRGIEDYEGDKSDY